ncbi:MAG: cell division protein FtsA [Cellulosilyticaceae bacterium]
MNHNLEQDYIFGLDIGTRTVIGIVGYMAEEKFEIVEYECMEHEERAMRDGQIHDIPKVVATVGKMKNKLEAKLGMTLQEVSIAAAGRVLDTLITEVTTEFDEIREVTYSDIKSLELHAIETAKHQLESKQKTKAFDYFCVGYSVINYYLDEYIISNLEGHKGLKIGVKLLATFLPKAVIDSLYTVTERVGLAVVNLTLEPIAAINAIIPEHLRMLNLALVDVGAGTSDIAITKEGSVVSYGMIPVAGDEVTETIVHQYLVDFNTAEKIKHDLSQNESITFEDIIGIPCEVPREEIEQVIRPTIETLATQVAEKILELNGNKSTNAVFCVGGGSQMIGFTELLCEKLNLPKQRVAMRTGEQVTNISNHLDVLKTPEVITPLGICLTTAKEKNNQFTNVVLNKKTINLMNTKKLTILDALVAGEIDHTNIFGKKGSTLMFRLNGERIRVKGENGTAAIITLNGIQGHLDSVIMDGDMIEVIPATTGKDGVARICDYIQETKITVSLNEEKIILPIALRKGVRIEHDTEIENGDDIEIMAVDTLGELLRAVGMVSTHKLVTVNFEVVDLAYKLENEDDIMIISSATQDCEVEPNRIIEKDIETQIAHCEATKIIWEDTIPKTIETVGIQVTVNGKKIVLPEGKTYMFANIFDFIDFNLAKPQGSIQLTLNGKRASVTDLLSAGDVLKIYWEK